MSRHASPHFRLVGCVVILVSAWSLATLAFVLVHSIINGLHFSGMYAGLFAGDQLRYLAWIRSAGLHGLIADPSVAGAPAVYLQPMFLISGLLWRAGLSLQLSYLLWTPFAIGTLIYGYARFTGRFLTGHEQAAALALALLFFSPFVPLLDYGGIVDANGANYLVIAAGHGATYWQAWGFLPTVLALGLMPVFLLGVLDEKPSRGIIVGTSLAGLLVSWLHPWGGAELVVMAAGLLLLERHKPQSTAVAIAGATTALPLLYYLILAQVDSAWSLPNLRSGASGPVWPLCFTVLPLGLVALPALRRRPETRLDRVLVLWLISVVVTFVALPGSRDVALEGSSLPLAILAVRSWRRWHATRAVSWLAILVAIVPGAFYSAHTFHDLFYLHNYPFALTDGEQRAVAALERDPARGPVLATGYLSAILPPFAGLLDGQVRAGSDAFFDGQLDSAEVERATGRATAVISDCLPGRANLAGLLRPLGFAATRYGCAYVYRR